MVAPGKGGGTQSDGLIPGRRFLFACVCALASFDALADPYAQAFQMWFLAVAGGCLACVPVELAAGEGRWPVRLALGVGLAIVNVFLYLAFVGTLIRVAPYFLIMLAAWVLPAARLVWLLARRPRPRA